MKKKAWILTGILLCACLVLSGTDVAEDQGKSVSTNKDKLLTLAVQGEIAPAEPGRSYATTWDGKPKMAIGIGGINYNLKIGNKVFGWAAGDRATVGVAAIGKGEDRFRSAWLNYVSIGNEVKVLNGDAKGEKGVVIGKFERYVLVHFDDAVLEKLSVGNTIQAKACGVGLNIEGFDNVFIHGLGPKALEKMNIRNVNGKLVVPVVKEIPAEIVGRGAGGSSLSGNWHIQTCYPPDIKKYRLNELHFGDLVLLENIQTDYGKGYFRGGATVGVVCSGPSDFSGLGVGVTPILSTRSGEIVARIDPAANIGKYLGLEMSKSAPKTEESLLPTNKDALISTAVQGVVQPPGSWGYSTTYDGKARVDIGMASINYTVSLGDTAYGWANADHVEPDVTFQGRDKPRASDCALAILACIGNEAVVLEGEAKGAKGFYIGRHAGSDDLAWFPKDVLEKLALNDKIQVKAKGVGLKIDGFEDVRVNKLSPELLENMGITIKDGQLVVPVVLEVPGHIMGSGIGWGFIEALDYDIQTTDPQIVEEFGLKKLRLGDLVAIRDHYDFYGNGRYEGAVTIGVCIHGWSDMAGHGPGLNPILSALPGKIKTRIDPHANTAYYLGIKPKPRL
ncbi:MAG: DUF4438 domain-containing protein [Candidatus Aminicenantes bacterium]|nr:MAG: DUF4438 domain-containing protein [Candidatus Aminicenantes bacterium]